MPRLLPNQSSNRPASTKGLFATLKNDKHYVGLTVQRRAGERESSGSSAGSRRPNCRIPAAPLGFGSQPYPPESQGVSDHGHGAEAHGRARDDRAQQQTKQR